MSSYFLVWGLILIFGFPLLSIILGELVERLKQRQNPLANFVVYLRRYTLPLLALLIILEEVFGLSSINRLQLIDSITEVELILRIGQSIVGITITFSFIFLLNAILTTGKKIRTWQIHVPNLLFQFARAAAFISGIMIILAMVWHLDISQVAAALGVGSLVMALALQDTLSNLVSGFLLIFEAPFKVGDWVRIQDLEGEIMEINWRAVRLKTKNRDIVIIPNGVLGKDTIHNYTAVDPLHADIISVDFFYNHSPNHVRAMLQNTALATDGIMKQPLPDIRTKSYNDFSIGYQVKYFVLDYAHIDQIRSELMTRIYYAAKRDRITIPFPTYMLHQFDGNVTQSDDERSQIIDTLKENPYFASINDQTLTDIQSAASVEYYGAGEVVVKATESDQALYLIISGSVLLSVDNPEMEITRLSAGDVFGEMVLLRQQTSLVTVQAIQDLTAIAIKPVILKKLIVQNPRFALEMNLLIEQRSKMLLLLQVFSLNKIISPTRVKAIAFRI